MKPELELVLSAGVLGLYSWACGAVNMRVNMGAAIAQEAGAVVWFDPRAPPSSVLTHP